MCLQIGMLHFTSVTHLSVLGMLRSFFRDNHFLNVLNRFFTRLLLRRSDAVTDSAQYIALQLKGSVKEPNKFHIYETEKITRKVSDAAEYIEFFGSFIRDRHALRI